MLPRLALFALALSATALPAAAAAQAPGQDGAWQGRWISPDGRIWQGSDPSQVNPGPANWSWPLARTPDSDEAMVIVPVLTTTAGDDPRVDWQAECQRRILAGGGQDVAEIGQSCAAWQMFYEQSGYWQPGLAYAVPVRLVTIPGQIDPLPPAADTAAQAAASSSSR